MPSSSTVSRQRTMLSPSNPRALVRGEIAAMNSGSGSVLGSIAVFCQSIIGGGLLAYPSTFATEGIGNVLLVQSVLLIFVAASLIVLAECTEKARSDTYQALVRRLLGRLKEGHVGMMNVHHHDNDADMAHWWKSPTLSHWLSALPVLCFSYQGHISAVPLYAELKVRTASRWYAVVGIGLAVCVLIYNISGLLGYLTFLDGTKSDVLSNFDESGSLFIGRGWIVVARAAVAIAVMTTFAVFQFCARAAIMNEVKIYFENNNDHNGVDDEDEDGEGEYSALENDVEVGGVTLVEDGHLHELSSPLTAAPSSKETENIKKKKNDDFLFTTVTAVWCGLVSIIAIWVPNITKMIAIVGNFSCFFMFHFPGMMLIAIVLEEMKEMESIEHNCDYHIQLESEDEEKLPNTPRLSGMRENRSVEARLDRMGKNGEKKKATMNLRNYARILFGVSFIMIGTLVFVLGLGSGIRRLQA
eukprot:g6339.t1